MARERKGREVRPRRRARRGRVLRRLLTLTVFIALVAIIVWMAPRVLTERSEVSSETVAMELRNIGELATQSGYYTNVQVIKSSRQLFGVDIPLTQSQFIFSYDGVVKAGVDFADIGIEVREAEHAIAYLRSIEAVTGLTCSGIVNNTHLCGETTPAEIRKGAALAEAVSRQTGIPILCHTAEVRFADAVSDLREPVFPITINMKKPWER